MTTTSIDQIVAAAQALALAGRWEQATALLEATRAADARGRARIAVAAVEVALLCDWHGDTREAAGRLRTAQQLCAAADVDDTTRWDLDFGRLRHDYFTQLFDRDRTDPVQAAALRQRGERLREGAPDDVRRGWVEFYLGVIADNLAGDRDRAAEHFPVALAAGESGGADLLSREALRHLGYHDRERGDHASALERWRRATALGARAGTVTGTLSQQIMLAELARDAGDEAGAVALAREIERWADAMGAARIAGQAKEFLATTEPATPPTH